MASKNMKNKRSFSRRKPIAQDSDDGYDPTNDNEIS